MENLKLIKPKHLIGVAVGALFSAIAIKSFVQPANLVPAGVGGVSIILIEEFKMASGITIPYGYMFLVINIILLLFVYKKLGKKFLALSFLHVFLTSFFVEALPQFHLTQDPILMAVFGGVLNGIGSSFALRMSGSAGGTDFIAIYFSMVKNKPMWDRIMYFNVALLVYYGWRFQWEFALYSILYQVVSTKVIETYHNRYKLSSLRIITGHPEDVSNAVFQVTRHGITKLDGIGVFKHQYKAMLYMVVNEFELKSIVDSIKAADPKAFIEISSVERIEGNYRQKPLE